MTTLEFSVKRSGEAVEGSTADRTAPLAGMQGNMA